MNYIVNLPKDKWHTCSRCRGTGRVEEVEDLHRSAGIVPCRKCAGGIVKMETISQEEYDKRKSLDAN